MTFHSIFVFVHVVSAIVLAGGTFISLFGLIALRRAQRVEEARSILGLLRLSEPLSALSLVLTPVAGLVLIINVWGWQNAWINVALGSMICLLLPVGAITGTRRYTIGKLVTKLPDGMLPDVVQQRLHDPVLGTAGYLMVTLVIGIEFLMTIKPALEGSLLAIAVFFMLGVTASLPMWRRRMDKGRQEPQSA